MGEEPPDVFCGLASLIVEGRVPTPGEGKGYSQGPHAPHQPGSPAVARHRCSGQDYICKKDENFRKHMLLLWQNNVPVCIEVLLCSDCRVGRQKASSVEYSTIPEPGSILLEQWTVSMSYDECGIAGSFDSFDSLPTAVVSSPYQISSRSLLQAVRSYLHFSQLSAWYSKSGGAEPRNILFRITIPDEAFSSKFPADSPAPEEHVFPTAVVGEAAGGVSVSVRVRSLPRTEYIPRVHCKHNDTSSLSGAPNDSGNPNHLVHQHRQLSSSSNSSDDPVASAPKTPSQKSITAEDEKLSVAGALLWRETDHHSVETDLRKTVVRNRMMECSGGGISPLGGGGGMNLAAASVSQPPSVNVSSQAATTAAAGNPTTTFATNPDPLTRSDSMDSMLGDSLLDPPQSLQKIPPKRYQSPSRCGSPSLEAPDHLLFGSDRHCGSGGGSGPENRKNFKKRDDEVSRLARQDLLRRRDLNSVMGLHPRIMNNNSSYAFQNTKPAGGNHFPPSSPMVASPVSAAHTRMAQQHPYRAFPPERPTTSSLAAAAAALPITQPHNLAITPTVLSSSFQTCRNEEGKCNITGKHICCQRDLAQQQDHHTSTANRQSRWDKSHPDQPSSREDGPASAPASGSGGARQKNAYLQGMNPKSRPEEDDEDDGGIEVAEYVNVPDYGLYPSSESDNKKSLANSKGLDELFDELTLAHHSACSSRRSSLKMGGVPAGGEEEKMTGFKSTQSVTATGKSRKKKGNGPAHVIQPPGLPGPFPLRPTTTEVFRAELSVPPPPYMIPPPPPQLVMKKAAATPTTSPLTPDQPALVLSDRYGSDRQGESVDNDDDCSSFLTDDGDVQSCVMMKPLERLRSFSENLHQQQQQENKAAAFETYPFPDVDCTAIDSADLSCPPSPSDETDESGVWLQGQGGTIPTSNQMDSFRKTLNSATSMVFHRSTGLPLSSSPAPLRKGKSKFDYDSSISKPTDIKRALFQNHHPMQKVQKLESEKENSEATPICSVDECQIAEDEASIGRLVRGRHPSRKILSASAPAAAVPTSTNLLGSFEESVLNGRLEPVSTVEGFTAEIGASGSFHPKHKTLPVTVFFYTLCDNSNISSPYLGHINLGKKGYRVPQKGTIQVTLFNPLGTVVKMFVVMYDLSDMPPNSQTFLRQRTLYMPTESYKAGADTDDTSQKWLRYLIHLRFASSKSGKIYLHTDIRMIIFRKSDLDTATDHAPGKGFELRSFTRGPSNPKFSPRR